MSKAIEVLMQEHRLIERVLTSLETFTATLQSGEAGSRDRVAEFSRFFREFADRCHHGKEEDLLFAALARFGMPTDMGPLKVMDQEHNLGRTRVRELSEIGTGEGPLDEGELDQVRKSATAFISLLRDHIMKEDNVLYPAADNNLDGEVMAELAREFEAFDQNQVGRDALQELHSLAEKLIKG